MTVNDLFEEARARIAVPDEMLKEARKRRDRIRKIVEEEFATLRTFPSGSLAHGTQNDAIRREEGGLWIPDLDNDTWEPSDPECHTELVVERNKETESHFARTLRLAKHANARHGKTIFSFNVTALGLEAVTEKVSLPAGLASLLRHAAESLDKGLTEDPAGVSGSIKVNVPRRKDAAKRFKEVADLAEEALDLEADGQMAQAQRNWSKVLPDAIDPPDDEDLKAELAAGLRKGNERVRQGAGA